MNVYQYRVPLDSNVSSYFKTFPLSVWSHKHFIENTDILDFEQATRLWYDNLTTIRNLPGSLVNKELFEVITKRKMGDTLTINKKKRKYAEDEVHTSSVTTSAELLKATFEHHKKYTQQKLDVPATPSPPSTVISVKNQDNEFFDETSTASEKTKTYNVSFDEYTQVESEKTKQKSRSNFLSSSTSNPLDNKVLNPDISLSDLSYLTNDSTKSSSEELKDENDEEIKFNLLDISMELQREPTVKWEVGNINVTDRFRKYQKDVLRKAEREGLYYENIYELLSLSSIIVICWPCPYPIFTNQEWSEIVKTNPYTIENHFLPQEISASLHEASCENFIGKEVFMNGGKTTLSKKIATSFNNLCIGLSTASPKIMEKITEEEHCYKFLYPITKPFFQNPLSEYKVVLNRATAGSRKRPDLSCVVDDVTILNSEIKPLRCTPLQMQKDILKAQLRARKSINMQLKNKGGPGRSGVFLNMGEWMESYIMDLRYDGLYRSWSFLTTKLVVDKASIPLAEYAISHVIALEERIGKIAESYKHWDSQRNHENRSSTTTPLISFMRTSPDTPQVKLILQ